MFAKTRIKIFLFILLVFGSVAILYIFNPSEVGLYPKCPFLSITGFQCPGCGSLRALHSLFHGSFITALSYNPLMVILLPYIVYESLQLCSNLYRGNPYNGIYIPSIYIWTLLVLIVIFGIIRNLSFSPFS